MNASGNNIERTAQRLLWIYKDEFTERKIEELKTLGKCLIRDANKKNPADLKAADALPLRGPLEMIEGAKRLEMMPIERTALDAFVISFATLSRMGEVLALRTEDVAEDGTRMRIRAKTDAKTWTAHVKAVSDGEGVFTIGTLVARRWKALEREDRSLFPSTRTAGRAMDSKEATHGLQLLVKHLRLPYRVSSHSARSRVSWAPFGGHTGLRTVEGTWIPAEVCGGSIEAVVAIPGCSGVGSSERNSIGKVTK